MNFKKIFRRIKKTFPILIGCALMIFSLLNLIHQFSIFDLIVTILMSLFVLAYIREMIWGKFQVKEIPIFKFEDEFIVCAGRYPFKHSSIKRYSKIHFSRINEVTSYNYSTSLVIDNAEVIFVADSEKENLKNFAVKNSIPISNRVDIWEKILEPYLEDKLSAEQEKENLQILFEQGIDEIELKNIRKKISWFMSFSFSVNWVYLGHQDFLEWKTSKKNYWWTMEIALRNFKNQKRLNTFI